MDNKRKVSFIPFFIFVQVFIARILAFYLKKKAKTFNPIFFFLTKVLRKNK